jgi:hypothetical protein
MRITHLMCNTAKGVPRTPLMTVVYSSCREEGGSQRWLVGGQEQESPGCWRSWWEATNEGHKQEERAQLGREQASCSSSPMLVALFLLPPSEPDVRLFSASGSPVPLIRFRKLNAHE